jgi:hypothetical protein
MSTGSPSAATRSAKITKGIGQELICHTLHRFFQQARFRRQERHHRRGHVDAIHPNVADPATGVRRGKDTATLEIWVFQGHTQPVHSELIDDLLGDAGDGTVVKPAIGIG